jgi:DNA-directed RNA polymerase specialized sigma24 family protein
MDDPRYHEMVDTVRRIRHDAISPITSVLGHVQLLMEEPAAQAAEVQETLMLVETELQRLVAILARLSELR